MVCGSEITAGVKKEVSITNIEQKANEKKRALTLLGLIFANQHFSGPVCTFFDGSSAG